MKIRSCSVAQRARRAGCSNHVLSSCSFSCPLACYAPKLPELSRRSPQYGVHQAAGQHFGCSMGADQEGFDEVVEVEARLAAARKHDLDKLVAGHAGHPYCGCAEAGARQRLGSETAKETFWKVLEHRGVRFTVGSNPTQCPIHGTRQCWLWWLRR